MTRLLALALLLFPAFATAGDATELRPGTIKLSGTTNLQLSRASTEGDEGEEADLTVLGLAARGFWFLTPNVGVGAAADVLRQSFDVAGDDATVTELTVGPALALHLPLDGRTALFAEVGAGLIRTDAEDFEMDGWAVSGRAGVSIFALPSVSFDLGLGLERAWLEPSLGDIEGPDATRTTVGAELGISVYFGR